MDIAKRIKRRRHLPRTLTGRIVAGAVLVVAVLAGLALAAGFFDSDPVHLFGVDDANRKPIAVVYFSGDMGLRFGMGSYVTAEMAARGVPVVGFSSPTLFGERRSHAQVDAIVADAMRRTLARTGAERLILMGQSYGSDVVGTGAANLPADLRARVAAVVLVVPGKTVFYRADPTELTYQGTPDGQAIDTMKTVTWAPVTCIYGQIETDSLCPLLSAPNVSRMSLPGGHFLRNDHETLVATILASLHPILGDRKVAS